MNMLNGLRAERLIAKRYEDRGYIVTLGPPRSAIPFGLGNYLPDILATKGDENILIEVKTVGARTDSEAYFRLDQEVQQHPGWRFLLVTVSDAELQENASNVAGNVDVETIRDSLRNMDQLLDDPKMSGLVMPSLWMAYVSALRLLGVGEESGIDGFSDYSLINKAYSDGVISFDEYEDARRLMTLRNRALHSLETAATPADCRQLRQLVRTLLDRLEFASPPAELSGAAQSK